MTPPACNPSCGRHAQELAGEAHRSNKNLTMGRAKYGQFSKVQSGKMGPAPGRFEHSKGLFE